MIDQEAARRKKSNTRRKLPDYCTFTNESASSSKKNNCIKLWTSASWYSWTNKKNQQVLVQWQKEVWLYSYIWIINLTPKATFTHGFPDLTWLTNSYNLYNKLIRPRTKETWRSLLTPVKWMHYVKLCNHYNTSLRFCLSFQTDCEGNHTENRPRK